MEVSSLVEKARKGNKEALVSLVMLRKDDYFRLACVYLHDRHDALDALQDMIIVVYENIRKLNNPESFYSWSKTILINCCKKIIKNKKMGLVQQEYDYPAAGYPKVYDITEQKQDIFQGLQKLNDFQREAIVLRYFLDWDYASIAEATAVPLGTVKSRISTGLTKLREFLEVENDYERRI